jgi:hypothetical protein
MPRLPDDPPAIVQQIKQSTFVCVACGAGRDCDCDAPAARRLADIKEQNRQRKIKQREKEQQDQQPRHVTEPEPQPQPEKESPMHPLPAEIPKLDAAADASVNAIVYATKLRTEMFVLLREQMTAVGRVEFLKATAEEIKRELNTPPF